MGVAAGHFVQSGVPAADWLFRRWTGTIPAKGMRFHLYQIPEEGIQRKLDIKVSSLSRLAEAFGPQPGSLTAHLFLKQRGGNVEVTGTVAGTLHVPCHRCLEPQLFEFEEAVAVTLVPEQRIKEMDDETALSPSDLDVTFFDGEKIDLAEIVEDEVFLAVPETLCEEDEQGRCTQCGKTLDDLFKPPEDDPEQHPLAQLRQFLKK